MVGALDGDSGLDSGSAFFDATTLEVSGDRSAAFVALGSASLTTFGFGSFLPAGCPIAVAALGVGVNGGAAWIRRVRCFVGVVN